MCVDSELHDACLNGDIVKVRSALTAGADPNWAHDMRGGSTGLMEACLFNHVEVVRTILQLSELNILINKQNKTGWTCLIYACRSSRDTTDIVKMLLQHRNLDIEIKDRYEKTAEIVARDGGKTEIVRLIQERLRERYEEVERKKREKERQIELVQPSAPPSTFDSSTQPMVSEVTAQLPSAPPLSGTQPIAQSSADFTLNDEEYEDMAVSSTSDGTNQMLKFIDDQIKEKEKELECPVCLEVCRESPILMCEEMHLICPICRPRVTICPQCRIEYKGPDRIHRYAEKIMEELVKLRYQRSKLKE